MFNRHHKGGHVHILEEPSTVMHPGLEVNDLDYRNVEQKEQHRKDFDRSYNYQRPFHGVQMSEKLRKNDGVERVCRLTWWLCER